MEYIRGRDRLEMNDSRGLLLAEEESVPVDPFWNGTRRRSGTEIKVDGTGRTLRSAHKYVNAIQEDNEALKVVQRRSGSCVPANSPPVVHMTASFRLRPGSPRYRPFRRQTHISSTHRQASNLVAPRRTSLSELAPSPNPHLCTPLVPKIQPNYQKPAVPQTPVNGTELKLNISQRATTDRSAETEGIARKTA